MSNSRPFRRHERALEPDTPEPQPNEIATVYAMRAGIAKMKRDTPHQYKVFKWFWRIVLIGALLAFAFALINGLIR